MHNLFLLSRLKYDRHRQKKLAECRMKEEADARLSSVSQNAQYAEAEISDLERMNLIQMQDSLILVIETKHARERKFLIDLLSKEHDDVVMEMTEIMSEDERECKLQDLLTKLDVTSGKSIMKIIVYTVIDIVFWYDDCIL